VIDHRKGPRLPLVARCTLICAIALPLAAGASVVALFLTVSISAALRVHAPEALVFPIAGIFHGAVYGFVQWRMLPGTNVPRRDWVFLSALGWLAAYMALGATNISAIASSRLDSIPGWLASGAFGLAAGALVGAAQSMAVSTVVSKRPWIVANSLGLAIGVSLVSSLVSLVPYGQGPGEGIAQGLALILLLPLPGAAIGASTGFSILRHSLQA